MIFIKNNTPIIISDYKLFYKDTIWFSEFNNCFIKIIDYIDKFNVKIKFLDEYGFETIANLDNIRKGNVKNPYRINKYGGFYGIGPYRSVDFMQIYKVWEGILKRTSDKYNDRKSYDNVSIDKSWLNFQNFADWYVNYIKDLNPIFIYQIDKDILQWNQTIKIYSAKTCCLIPDKLNVSLVGLNLKREINPNLPVGVYHNDCKYSSYITNDNRRIYLGNFDNPDEAFEKYKQEKLRKIYNIALYYYSQNGIKKDIFEALCKLNLNGGKI